MTDFNGDLIESLRLITSGLESITTRLDAIESRLDEAEAPQISDQLGRILLAHHTGGVSHVISNLGVAECNNIRDCLINRKATFREILDTWGLKASEDGGFWYSTVLPAIEKRIRRSHLFENNGAVDGRGGIAAKHRR